MVDEWFSDTHIDIVVEKWKKIEGEPRNIRQILLTILNQNVQGQRSPTLEVLDLVFKIDSSIDAFT